MNRKIDINGYTEIDYALENSSLSAVNYSLFPLRYTC